MNMDSCFVTVTYDTPLTFFLIVSTSAPPTPIRYLLYHSLIPLPSPSFIKGRGMRFFKNGLNRGGWGWGGGEGGGMEGLVL